MYVYMHCSSFHVQNVPVYRYVYPPWFAMESAWHAHELILQFHHNSKCSKLSTRPSSTCLILMPCIFSQGPILTWLCCDSKEAITASVIASERVLKSAFCRDSLIKLKVTRLVSPSQLIDWFCLESNESQN